MVAKLLEFYRMRLMKGGHIKVYKSPMNIIILRVILVQDRNITPFMDRKMTI